jgi:hypothetical protein
MGGAGVLGFLHCRSSRACAALQTWFEGFWFKIYTGALQAMTQNTVKNCWSGLSGFCWYQWSLYSAPPSVLITYKYFYPFYNLKMCLCIIVNDLLDVGSIWLKYHEFQLLITHSSLCYTHQVSTRTNAAYRDVAITVHGNFFKPQMRVRPVSVFYLKKLLTP